MSNKIINEITKREKFNKFFLEIAFPSWMHSSIDSHNFRGYVLDKHMILENLLDLLITAYFFKKINLKKSDYFKEKVLAYIDFSKKTEIAKKLGLINKSLVGLIYKVNDYRVAQSHIRKNNPLRIPNRENWNIFRDISTKTHNEIATKIMLTDINLRAKVEKITKK